MNDPSTRPKEMWQEPLNKRKKRKGDRRGQKGGGEEEGEEGSKRGRESFYD